MSTVLLCVNDNKADATTSFADESGTSKTITPAGNAQYDTAQAPTGMTSSGLFDGTGDYLDVATNTDFGWGTGDFTIEFMLRSGSIADSPTIIDFRTTDPEISSTVYVTVGGVLTYYVNGADRITSAALAIVINTWYHIAVARSGTSTKMFKDGTQVGSTFSDSNNYGATKPFRAGGNVATEGNSDLNGWISNIRVNKGTAVYTANFTPPTLPFSGAGAAGRGLFIAPSLSGLGAGGSFFHNRLG